MILIRVFLAGMLTSLVSYNNIAAMDINQDEEIIYPKSSEVDRTEFEVPERGRSP